MQVQRARAMLPDRVQVLEMPLETPYIRDTAPFVRPSLLLHLSFHRDCRGQSHGVSPSFGMLWLWLCCDPQLGMPSGLASCTMIASHDMFLDCQRIACLLFVKAGWASSLSSSVAKDHAARVATAAD